MGGCLAQPRSAVPVPHTHAGGDRARALYEWNAQVSAALQRDLAHLEVALRNAYDTAASAHSPRPGHWLRDDAARLFAPLLRTKKKNGQKYQVDVNRKQRAIIAQAVRDAGGPQVAPGKVVAQLNFGFWRYLSSSAHEKTLWVPLLHHAFPVGTRRADVDGRVGACTSSATGSRTTSPCSTRTCPRTFGTW